jgi:hypothetical protein
MKGRRVAYRFLGLGVVWAMVLAASSGGVWVWYQQYMGAVACIVGQRCLGTNCRLLDRVYRREAQQMGYDNRILDKVSVHHIT